MKNNLVLLFFLALTVSVSAQSLPDRKETLEVMKKVNGYFMKSMPITRFPVLRPCTSEQYLDTRCLL